MPVRFHIGRRLNDEELVGTKVELLDRGYRATPIVEGHLNFAGEGLPSLTLDFPSGRDSSVQVDLEREGIGKGQEVIDILVERFNPQSYAVARFIEDLYGARVYEKLYNFRGVQRIEWSE